MTKWLAPLVVLSLAAPALAQPMRCSGRLIEPGVAMAAVLELCGQPSVHREWTEVIPAGDDDEGMMEATRIPMAEWVYGNNGDPDLFPSKVLFRDGVVQEVKN
ncbi:MAG: DUF2845 domain-containing protein [Candidatus Binatia bacterium]